MGELENRVSEGRMGNKEKRGMKGEEGGKRGREGE